MGLGIGGVGDAVGDGYVGDDDDGGGYGDVDGVDDDDRVGDNDHIGDAQDRGDYHCNSCPAQIFSSFARILPLLLILLTLR